MADLSLLGIWLVLHGMIEFLLALSALPLVLE